MYSLRPAQLTDLDILLNLACNQGKRQASLPKSHEQLKQFILSSDQAFRHSVNSSALSKESSQPYSTASYVWVISWQKQIVGTIAIEACTGLREPFYSYRQETLINGSYRLNIKQEIPVLYQSHELAGMSQLHGITLLPEHRNQHAINLLIQGVLLYITEHHQRFCRNLLVEFPGYKDERNQSPLWKDLGQHFFQMSLEQACYHASVEDKALIAQLMPNHPLYQNLLSSTCQANIGAPQQDLMDYYHAFMNEGFSASTHIDIFDGGPCLICAQEKAFTSRQSNRITLEHFVQSQQPQILLNTHKHTPVALLLTPEWTTGSEESLHDFLGRTLSITNHDWLRTVNAHSGETVVC